MRTHPLVLLNSNCVKNGKALVTEVGKLRKDQLLRRKGRIVEKQRSVAQQKCVNPWRAVLVRVRNAVACRRGSIVNLFDPEVVQIAKAELHLMKRSR